MRHCAKYSKPESSSMHITLKVVIITPIFTGEFTETQLCELACSMIELGFKFAMPCCKYYIIHSFFSLLFVQYFYLNKNIPGSFQGLGDTEMNKVEECPDVLWFTF